MSGGSEVQVQWISTNGQFTASRAKVSMSVGFALPTSEFCAHLGVLCRAVAKHQIDVTSYIRVVPKWHT